jgi:putative DNA primase/helicase
MGVRKRKNGYTFKCFKCEAIGNVGTWRVDFEKTDKDEAEEDGFFRKGLNPVAVLDELEAEGHRYLGYAEEVYRYENGVYKPDEVRFEQTIREMLATRASTGHVEQSRSAVISKYHDRLTDSRNVINFNDCLLDMSHDTLSEGILDHSPGHKSVVQFPIDFRFACDQVHKGKGEATKQYLQEIVGKQNVIPLMEMVGSIFHSDSPSLQKAFLLLGGGSNGKGTFTTIVQRMVGSENICTTGWSKFNDKFPYATYELVGKALALDADYSRISALSPELKKVIEGESIWVRQIYGKAIMYAPTCTMICACNELPKTEDTSHGYFRRFNIIRFPFTFPMDRTKGAELIKQFTQIDEQAGFVARCLDRYKQAYTRGYFTEPHGHVEELSDYQAEVDPVSGFIDDMLIACESAILSRTEVYGRYKKWHSLNRVDTVLNNRVFYRKLKERGAIIDEKPARYPEHDKNIRAIHGYAFP